MTRIVALEMARAEWLKEETVDGYWSMNVGERLRTTYVLAKREKLVWLSPYIPQYARQQNAQGNWRTDAAPAGFVRATDARALRLHFRDSAKYAEDCVTVRLLNLVHGRRLVEPGTRWADMGTMLYWPIALRIDAERLADRLQACARATWCVECDSAPWASSTRRCLWCERIGGPPAPVPVKPLVEQAA